MTHLARYKQKKIPQKNDFEGVFIFNRNLESYNPFAFLTISSAKFCGTNS